MQNLLDAFKTIRRELEEMPSVPVAFVVKPALLMPMRARLCEGAALFQVSVFSDHHQEADCLAFYDDLTLRCYLVRFDCLAYAWLISGNRAQARKVLYDYYDAK